MSVKQVKVAVGVVVKAGQILLARRNLQQHQGGKWEFPGGKIEAGESTPAALTRELKEECDISATQMQPLILIEHDYGDKKVSLDTYIVSEFTGQAKGLEGQTIQWTDFNRLAEFDFPDANVAILKALEAYLVNE
ncbi:8-oxo-dGTP diphosphatase MutT [Catenovulum adriaticum]|uniref:8-oxo-dGTP diphosphatase n=1 Tax=Catenovulum adriaticum TaxID=2984846 RepID=A0ABY7AMT6_9ALTE|nr:8-oxo-dGTP diphosphatase MutT [Catenovulum sp. TS8]WAJ69649.1 8-oxo-dGTP diphosphatase MutT [Catenovulum sp. TS8]